MTKRNQILLRRIQNGLAEYEKQVHKVANLFARYELVLQTKDCKNVMDVMEILNTGLCVYDGDTCTDIEGVKCYYREIILPQAIYDMNIMSQKFNVLVKKYCESGNVLSKDLNTRIVAINHQLEQNKQKADYYKHKVDPLWQIKKVEESLQKQYKKSNSRVTLNLNITVCEDINDKQYNDVINSDDLCDTLFVLENPDPIKSEKPYCRHIIEGQELYKCPCFTFNQSIDDFCYYGTPIVNADNIKIDETCSKQCGNCPAKLYYRDFLSVTNKVNTYWKSKNKGKMR